MTTTKLDTRQLNPIVADAIRAIDKASGTALDVIDADHTYVTLRVRFDDLDAVAKAVSMDDDDIHVDCLTEDDAGHLRSVVRSAIDALEEAL